MAGAVARLLVAIEPRVRVTGMVKHAVEDQAHPFTLRIVAQAHQRGIATELRIDTAVISGIVFMYAGRDEYRIEIQRSHAKLLQIRKLLANTVEVAAIKVEPPASPVNGSSHAFSTISGRPHGGNKPRPARLLAPRYGRNDRGKFDKDLIGDPLRAAIRHINRKLLQPRGRKRWNPCGVNHN